MSECETKLSLDEFINLLPDSDVCPLSYEFLLDSITRFSLLHKEAYATVNRLTKENGFINLISRSQIFAIRVMTDCGVPKLCDVNFYEGSETFEHYDSECKYTRTRFGIWKEKPHSSWVFNNDRP